MITVQRLSIAELQQITARKGRDHKQEIKNELVNCFTDRQKPLSLRKCQSRIMSILKDMDIDQDIEEFTDNLMELVNHQGITVQLISIAVEGVFQDNFIDPIEDLYPSREPINYY